MKKYRIITRFIFFCLSNWMDFVIIEGLYCEKKKKGDIYLVLPKS